jgi:hypothetical protein
MVGARTGQSVCRTCGYLTFSPAHALIKVSHTRRLHIVALTQAPLLIYGACMYVCSPRVLVLRAASTMHVMLFSDCSITKRAGGDDES